MHQPTPREIADHVLEHAISLLISNRHAHTVCLKELLQAYIEAMRVEANELEDRQPEHCPCFVCNGEYDIPPGPKDKTFTLQDMLEMIDGSNEETREEFIAGEMVDDIFDDLNNDNEKDIK